MKGHTYRLEKRARSASLAACFDAYFNGRTDALDDIAVEPGGTAFQGLVWSALRTIEPGTTWTYGKLANAIGHPHAARAVGLANGANPVGIVIPCHRVLAAGGRIGGYSGSGGTTTKRQLLVLEGAMLAV